MLTVTQKTDHALALMRHLALKEAAVSLADVAKAEAISQGYLEEVAGLLRAAKLIEGRRGIGGGYVLARPATELTVADVVTAIEGPKWTGECLGESKRPVRSAANAALWRKVQGQVMTVLRGITLAELVTVAAPVVAPAETSRA